MASRRLLKRTALSSLLVIVGILALAFTTHPLRASSTSFTLYGSISPPTTGWGLTSSTIASPGPDLTVLAGEKVSISLHSADGATHNWGVDYNGNGIIDPGEPVSSNFFFGVTTFNFTATTTAGVYTYWCFLHKGPMRGSFIVQDFSISANPTTIGPLSSGAQDMSTITVSPMNGFTGTVTLTTTPSTGLTAMVSPTSVSVTGTMTETSTLTVSAAVAGTYNVNVTGTSGSISHTVKVTVYVGADFTITSNQASLSINQGSSSTDTLTLQSLNGFSGSVTLMATVTSGGPSATLNPPTVTLSPATSGQSTVQVSTSSGIYSSTSLGTYTVNVTGTSGSLSHSTTVTITVTSGASGTGNLPTTVIAGVVVAIVAAVAVATFAVRRSRHKK